MGFEPTDGTLGRYCLTTWRHPRAARGLYQLTAISRQLSAVSHQASVVCQRSSVINDRNAGLETGNWPFDFGANPAGSAPSLRVYRGCRLEAGSYSIFLLNRSNARWTAHACALAGGPP